MLLQFKQAAHLGGKDYSLGIHDVPESLLQNVFLQKLVQAGLVIEPTAAQLISAKTFAERQHELSDKLMGVKPKQIVEKVLDVPKDKSDVKVKKKKE